VTEPGRLNLPFYPRREAMTLGLLTGVAIVGFVAVTGLSRIYLSQQESLAERWSARGAADLKAERFAAAVTDFRAALLYARDSYSYQLSLAQALLGMRSAERTDEAYAYLLNLWDREPENGFVNLELARIAAEKGDTARALRFYHNAIYATWPVDQIQASRNARLELIQYLLRIKARTQAQAELIALAANLGENSPEQEQIGELFLNAQDSQHALDAFEHALKQNRRDHAALAGAGIAAFQLGLYPTARDYLQAALQVDHDDTQSADWLRKTELVFELDPYRPQISDADRARVAINVFTTAGNRLKACPANAGAFAATLASLTQQWDKLKPQIAERSLISNPDLEDSAMDLAFRIELQTSGVCGPSNDADNAMIAIANLHEED
jgi:tetratricopeptide (TPR) repeat protein